MDEIVGGVRTPSHEFYVDAALKAAKTPPSAYWTLDEYLTCSRYRRCAAVYKDLITHYAPGNIGIYGCSAGGVLTAQAVAWFQKEKLPRPGAIGIFCIGAGAPPAGDSRHTEGLLDASMGLAASPPPAKPDPAPIPMSYFKGVNMADPLVSPLVSPAILSNFPPTLLATGTRDLGLSAVVHTHAELVKAGVDADLHVWGGMGHNFLIEMDLPESREAYNVITKFFASRLGKSGKER